MSEPGTGPDAAPEPTAEPPPSPEPPPTGQPAPGPGSTSPGALPDRVRRRLDDVFGDVLPEVTRDEVAEAPADRPASADAWLRANRPPHHDDRG